MIYPAALKLQAIEREVRYRKFVFPKRVRRGKISQARADEEISIFEAIAEDYRGLVGKERLL